MVKQLIFPLLLLPCLLAAYNNNVNFIDGNLPAAQARALQEGKPYFVHYTATWCMPCQWMEEHTFQDVALAGYVAENYLAVRMDYDSKEADTFKKQYDVTTLPTTLIFNAEGHLLSKHENSLDAAQLLKILYEHRQSLRPQQPRISAPPARTVAYQKKEQDISRPALIPDEMPATKPSARNETTTATARPDAYRLQPTESVQNPSTSAPRSVANYAIQVGVYSDADNAKRTQTRMAQRFDQFTRIQELDQNGKTLYRVLVGAFEQKTEAENYLHYLKQNDVKGFVKNVDN